MRKLEENVKATLLAGVLPPQQRQTGWSYQSFSFSSVLLKTSIVCGLIKVCAYFPDLVAVQNLSSQETNSIPQDQISTADMDGVCNT